MKQFFRTFRLQIIALLCALLLWLYVALNKRYDATVELPIWLDNVPEQLQTPAVRQKAKAVVQGTGRQIFLLRYQEVGLLLDAEGAEPGTNRFNLHSGMVTLSGAPSLKLSWVKSPSEISLDFLPEPSAFPRKIH